MSASLKIGLTQRVETVPSYNERRDCLDQAWGEFIRRCGLMPVPLPNRGGDAQQLICELRLDGVILTGGNDLACLPDSRTAAPERDAFERGLLALCETIDLPVFGVCRGLQMLVNYHGGALVPVKHHVRKPHAIRVVSEVDQSFPLIPREEVNSFHDYGIRSEDLGVDLLPLAIAPDGSVEAVRHRTLRQCGVMWHPERDPRDDRDVDLVRAFFSEGGNA